MENLASIEEFALDVEKGLSSTPKYLQSKYLYNQKGSKIFEDIMRMPEYYLTDSELEIIEMHHEDISISFNCPDTYFEIIELGAGDGVKTKILLAHLLKKNNLFKYIPIDISAKAIKNLENDLSESLPNLNYKGLIGDYFQLIPSLNGTAKKLLLFLGSNIGNFNQQESIYFLKKINRILHRGDQLLIGFDLKKDPEIILDAYNDAQGLTAAFNLNLLHRMNEELEADFNPNQFTHKEVYVSETGTAKSYLISHVKQQVHIHKINKSFWFQENESIYMEMSQKYDIQMIESLAEQAGFEIINHFYDQPKWFVNSLWKVK